MGNILNHREYFFSNVPNDVLGGIVRKVVGGTRDAAQGIGSDVKEGRYTKHAARDLFPYTRRGRIETCFFDLSSEFPETIESANPGACRLWRRMSDC